MRYIHPQFRGLSGAVPADTAAQASSWGDTQPRLRKGSTGPAVLELQRQLNILASQHACGSAVPVCQSGASWPCQIDAPAPTFGPKTDAQVRAFQIYANRHGQDVGRTPGDGDVGQKTWAAISTAAWWAPLCPRARSATPDEHYAGGDLAAIVAAEEKKTANAKAKGKGKKQGAQPTRDQQGVDSTAAAVQDAQVGRRDRRTVDEGPAETSQWWYIGGAVGILALVGGAIYYSKKQ